jgi:hypothetical protein
MSLVASASVWTNDNQTRKRQSTMRKTVKIRPYNDSSGEMDPDEYVSTSENYQNLQNTSPPTISDIQTSNSEKSSHVNEMLNKITSFNSENDGNKLADFKPLPPGTLTNNREQSKDANSYNATKISHNLDPSELLPQTISHSSGSGDYLANTSKSDYSNYQQTYENSPKLFQNQPYYSKMGIGATGGPGDEKLIEKINYMIHLLEENQIEKTSNITEEFLLYLFLGVFVIFTVDSFTRARKYVR